jgi:hypothetical protein
MFGEDKGGEIWLTVFWFEGRIFREGEVGGMAGGAICVEVRLEVVLEVRRGDEAKGRGEGGTEFKSGAMILGGSLFEEDTRGRWTCSDRIREGSCPLPVALLTRPPPRPFNVVAWRYETKGADAISLVVAMFDWQGHVQPFTLGVQPR